MMTQCLVFSIIFTRFCVHEYRTNAEEVVGTPKRKANMKN